MKQYQFKICILFVCISSTFLFPQKSYCQLSGNYTINPTKSASSTNYRNWASAIGDLITGTRTDGGTQQGSGVSGPVTFSVYDTLYANTNIAITAIAGASRTNTITFKSAKGDSFKCKLEYASSSVATDDYVLLLDGADFITFQQIGMERTGSNTYSTVVQITNDADNNKFINCFLKGIRMPSNSTNGFGYGIGSCIYLAGNGDSIEITNNKLLYGYNGVYGAIAGSGVKIKGNSIDTSGSTGIFMGLQTKLNITGNSINLGDFGTSIIQYTTYGIRVETSPSFIISKNKINLFAVNADIARAIILYLCVSTSAAPAMVYNNWIYNNAGTMNCTGLASYGCDYLNFYFNNVLITNSMATGCAYFHNPSYTNTYIKLLNNNLINKGGGYAYSVTGTNTVDLDSVNFNNAYSSGTYIGNWTGNNYTTLSAWKTASGKDANSVSIDPNFISNTNLHIVGFGLKGKGIPYYSITDDIDGDARDKTAPYIGADEIPPTVNDAGITALYKPLAGTCVGVLPVLAVINNFGTGTLTKATIEWSVAGIPQTPYNWTGNLNTNKKDTVTIGTFDFSSNANPKFLIKSIDPNGVKDEGNFNDSILLVRALRPPPNANAGADFSICLGDSTIIGPTKNATYGYKWTTLAGTTIGTTSQIMVKPVVKTSYVLEVTIILYGCTKKDTITLSINNKPVADAGADKTICLGATAQLGATPQSGFSYAWTSQPTGFNSTIANPSVNPTTTTTYYIEKTITATGCKATDFAIVTVNLPPTPNITGLKVPCNKDMASYTTTANTGSAYSWDMKGGMILNGQSTNTINVKWTIADTGYLSVIETNANTCVDSVQYMVIVSPRPTAEFTMSNFCLGSTTQFNDISVNTLSSAWKFGDGGTSIIPNPNHKYITIGDYPVTLIVKNSFGCPDTTNQQVTIHPLPVASFGITKSAEKKYTFTDSSTIATGNITKWHWNFGISDTSILQNPNFQFSTAGNIKITLCVTSSFGCNNCIDKNLNIVNVFSQTVNKRLIVSPNPGNGVFKITSTSALTTVTITNLTGQIIRTIQPEAKSFMIDLSMEPNGIYFVKVMMNEQEEVVKLIKQ